MEDFVMVYRKEHGDYMCISKRVAIEYPEKFKVEEPPVEIEPEIPEPEVPQEPTKSVKTTRKNK